MMLCILCGEPWQQKAMPFSAVCEKCHCWLHSCIQCALWDSRSRMCKSMTTDSVADRQGKNFCEEWKPHDTEATTDMIKNPVGKFASLFGD
ncbi:MAG: hypothetical protein K8S62_13180 [Candidatus Sabulitectum sp.]|nr:hypothetical protein [Candidatus Sabulitectum sp.]